MKTKNTDKAIKSLSAEAIKAKADTDFYSLVLLVFSMIGASTVLQLVFLA